MFMSLPHRRHHQNVAANKTMWDEINATMPNTGKSWTLGQRHYRLNEEHKNPTDVISAVSPSCALPRQQEEG
jgi:hypothetical protein